MNQIIVSNLTCKSSTDLPTLTNDFTTRPAPTPTKAPLTENTESFSLVNLPLIP